ncbi:MAG: flagellar export chaperone FliS [Vicinamibacterales bacterium]
MNRGVDAYRQVNAETRSPMELVVMLYDGAIRFVGDARAAADRNDVVARTRAVSRALAIVTELQNALHLEDGGDVARELDRLYSYMTTRLIDSNVKRDRKALDEVHRLLSTVRDGWAQATPAARASA